MSFVCRRSAAKPNNRACGAWKCTPIPAVRDFPRRGKFTLRSTFTLISSSKYSAAKISPSGEDVAAGDRRGAFPAGASPVVKVFAAIGSAAAAGGIYYSPLNQPALWADPEPPGAQSRQGPDPSCVQEYNPADNSSDKPTADSRQLCRALSHCPTSPLVHQLTSSPAH